VDVLDSIKEQINSNAIILYMKGSPQAPQCGFSAQTVQCLMACGERFAYVDVLSNPDVRANLPAYANWPTFPQLWVEGELVGGCDIVTEMFQSGELKTLIAGAALGPRRPRLPPPRNSLHSRSGQPPISCQRLTIAQNSAAVTSAS
jgi:monothiol glutaredoxin